MNSSIAPQSDGIYRGIPFADYLAWDAVSNSAQYDIYDFEDLGVAKGLIFSAALAAIVAFIVLFF